MFQSKKRERRETETGGREEIDSKPAPGKVIGSELTRVGGINTQYVSNDPEVKMRGEEENEINCKQGQQG